MIYKNIVFVFGSNTAGIHGAGAAKHAADKWGAQRGIGHGPTGSAYALPTKDYTLRTLPMSVIEQNIEHFAEYARDNPTTLFLLTPVGTGLAGIPLSDIRAVVRRIGLPKNVTLYPAQDWMASKRSGER